MERSSSPDFSLDIPAHHEDMSLTLAIPKDIDEVSNLLAVEEPSWGGLGFAGDDSVMMEMMTGKKKEVKVGLAAVEEGIRKGEVLRERGKRGLVLKDKDGNKVSNSLTFLYQSECRRRDTVILLFIIPTMERSSSPDFSLDIPAHHEDMSLTLAIPKDIDEVSNLLAVEEPSWGGLGFAGDDSVMMEMMTGKKKEVKVGLAAVEEGIRKGEVLRERGKRGLVLKDKDGNKGKSERILELHSNAAKSLNLNSHASRKAIPPPPPTVNAPPSVVRRAEERAERALQEAGAKMESVEAARHALAAAASKFDAFPVPQMHFQEMGIPPTTVVEQQEEEEASLPPPPIPFNLRPTTTLPPPPPPPPPINLTTNKPNPPSQPTPPLTAAIVEAPQGKVTTVQACPLTTKLFATVNSNSSRSISITNMPPSHKSNLLDPAVFHPPASQKPTSVSLPPPTHEDTGEVGELEEAEGQKEEGIKLDELVEKKVKEPVEGGKAVEGQAEGHLEEENDLARRKARRTSRAAEIGIGRPSTAPCLQEPTTTLQKPTTATATVEPPSSAVAERRVSALPRRVSISKPADMNGSVPLVPANSSVQRRPRRVSLTSSTLTTTIAEPQTSRKARRSSIVVGDTNDLDQGSSGSTVPVSVKMRRRSSVVLTAEGGGEKKKSKLRELMDSIAPLPASTPLNSTSTSSTIGSSTTGTLTGETTRAIRPPPRRSVSNSSSALQLDKGVIVPPKDDMFTRRISSSTAVQQQFLPPHPPAVPAKNIHDDMGSRKLRDTDRRNLKGIDMQWDEPMEVEAEWKRRSLLESSHRGEKRKVDVREEVPQKEGEGSHVVVKKRRLEDLVIGERPRARVRMSNIVGLGLGTREVLAKGMSLHRVRRGQNTLDAMVQESTSTSSKSQAPPPSSSDDTPGTSTSGRQSRPSPVPAPLAETEHPEPEPEVEYQEHEFSPDLPALPSLPTSLPPSQPSQSVEPRLYQDTGVFHTAETFEPSYHQEEASLVIGFGGKRLRVKAGPSKKEEIVANQAEEERHQGAEEEREEHEELNHEPEVLALANNANISPLPAADSSPLPPVLSTTEQKRQICDPSINVVNATKESQRPPAPKSQPREPPAKVKPLTVPKAFEFGKSRPRIKDQRKEAESSSAQTTKQSGRPPAKERDKEKKLTVPKAFEFGKSRPRNRDDKVVEKVDLKDRAQGKAVLARTDRPRKVDGDRAQTVENDRHIEPPPLDIPETQPQTFQPSVPFSANRDTDTEPVTISAQGSGNGLAITSSSTPQAPVPHPADHVDNEARRHPPTTSRSAQPQAAKEKGKEKSQAVKRKAEATEEPPKKKMRTEPKPFVFTSGKSVRNKEKDKAPQAHSEPRKGKTFDSFNPRCLRHFNSTKLANLDSSKASGSKLHKSSRKSLPPPSNMPKVARKVVSLLHLRSHHRVSQPNSPAAKSFELAPPPHSDFAHAPIMANVHELVNHLHISPPYFYQSTTNYDSECESLEGEEGADGKEDRSSIDTLKDLGSAESVSLSSNGHGSINANGNARSQIIPYFTLHPPSNNISSSPSSYGSARRRARAFTAGGDRPQFQTALAPNMVRKKIRPPSREPSLNAATPRSVPPLPKSLQTRK
ncbi:hypothetical protein BT69DRAFT_1327871 [Atractiella rhizophila]|nr:hypothetical protein BT69DRAFT_1327871 [Atractiella rhizophila]